MLLNTMKRITHDLSAKVICYFRAVLIPREAVCNANNEARNQGLCTPLSVHERQNAKPIELFLMNVDYIIFSAVLVAL